MKNAIIIHGILDADEDQASIILPATHWYPWLKESLEERGVKTEVPAMPDPVDPTYEKWVEVFAKFEITPETILIGHSCGAGFLVRWLSENKITAGKVVLVAPWMDPDKELNTNFFDFEVDTTLINRIDGLSIMYSLDDESTVIKTVGMMKKEFPNAVFEEYTNQGHFTFGDMGTVEFPEILKTLSL